MSPDDKTLVADLDKLIAEFEPGTWRRTVGVLTRAKARIAALTEALREVAVGDHQERDEEWHGCRLCRDFVARTGEWRRGQPENHAPGCLAAAGDPP